MYVYPQNTHLYIIQVSIYIYKDLNVFSGVGAKVQEETRARDGRSCRLDRIRRVPPGTLYKKKQ